MHTCTYIYIYIGIIIIATLIYVQQLLNIRLAAPVPGVPGAGAAVLLYLITQGVCNRAPKGLVYLKLPLGGLIDYIDPPGRLPRPRAMLFCCLCVFVFIYVYIYIYMYIDIHIERERERERQRYT